MEDIITPEEKDKVLNGCANTSTEYFLPESTLLNEGYARKRAILRILYLDKYMSVVSTESGTIIYRLSDEGLVFRQWGGYTKFYSISKEQEERREEERREWELRLKKYERSTQIKIFIWSAIITIVNTLISFFISFFFK